MANSADPDQLALKKKPTDLDLHCLQRQGISGLSRTRIKCIIQVPVVIECTQVLVNRKEE